MPLPSPLRLIRLLGLIVIFVFCTHSPIFAESLSVSLSVGDTYYVVNGWTSPLAQVTVKENSAVIATTQALLDGSFTVSVLAEPGLHEYSLYAIDSSSLASATYTQTVSLSGGTTTTVNNFVVPPTLTTTQTTYSLGTPISISGQTVPGSQILIFLDDDQVVTTTSNSNGSWGTEISTTALTLSAHTLYAKTQITGGYSSENSSQSTITIVGASVAPSAGVSSSNSPTNTVAPTTPPTNQSAPDRSTTTLPWFPLYDRDRNGILSIRDLTGIMTQWVTSLRDYLRGNTTTTATRKCDINSDKKCDIFDFSILLYYIDRQV